MFPERYLTALWGRRGLGAWLLLPLAGIFRALSALRRGAYRLGLCRSTRLPVPVVVVGNITVGGAGKTPLTLFLAQGLQRLGKRPGIVSRGYGGNGQVQEVRAESLPAAVGDEPVLMKRRFGGPVFVGRRRADAAQALLNAYPDCNVLLCDDGLQHYGLQRDMEIAVFDRRGILNGWPLPAGPLREPVGRLRGVAAVVSPAALSFPLTGQARFHMVLDGRRFYRLGSSEPTCGPEALLGLRLHAVAGIGEPQRFFDHLTALGLSFTPHAFPTITRTRKKTWISRARPS